MLAQYPDTGWPYPSNNDGGWSGVAGKVFEEMAQHGAINLWALVLVAVMAMLLVAVIWKFNGPATEWFRARVEEAQERKKLVEERKNYYIRASAFISEETEFQDECKEALSLISKSLDESAADTKDNMTDIITALCNFADSLVNATMPLDDINKARFEAVKREVLGIRQIGERLK